MRADQAQSQEWSGLRRHRLDHVSGLFGIVFLVVGLNAVLSPGGVRALDLALLTGVLAITAGVSVVLSVLRRIIRGPQTWDPEPRRDEPLVSPMAAVLTPDAIRDEDREWFGLEMPLSEVEREIQAALAAEDGEIAPGGE